MPMERSKKKSITMNKHRVLLLGSGGREHAIAHSINKSSKLEKLFVAPGNAGTGQIAENVELSLSDFSSIKHFIEQNQVNLLIIGPEQPLVDGLVDFLDQHFDEDALCTVGPHKQAAQLEGSKDFSKQFMQRHNIPTAKYQTFTKGSIEKGFAFLETLQAPYVIKADGLAAGKGVIILNNLLEAKDTLKEMLYGDLVGNAAEKVVIEEFLDGIEVSFFALVNGNDYCLLPHAKDYKRIGEGDTGKNTGGMGSISPVPFVDEAFEQKVKTQIIEPTIQGLAKEKIHYQGFIFFGLINCGGQPKVIEYNARMGDPETQVVFSRINSDVLELFEHYQNKSLSAYNIEINPQHCASVIMVSGGYPGSYEKGKTITGFNKTSDQSMIFHAGTKLVGNSIFTNGGRVLAATNFGGTLKEALAQSYQNLDALNFDYAYYRKDIGHEFI